MVRRPLNIFAALNFRLPQTGFRQSTLARFLRREDGVAAVEYAFVALPFLGLMFAILQTAIVFMADQQLETATEQASRYLLTGQAQDQGLTQAQFAKLVCNQISALFNCNNLMVDIQTPSSFSSANTSTPTLTFNSSGQVTNTWGYNTGAPGAIVVMRVMYQWPLVKGPLSFNLSNLSNGNRLMMATAVFKNEPYQ
jgi:Flp pilus assembly protein TadG